MTNQNKRITSLFKDTAIFAIGNFGSKILTFLLVPLYTNILTTAEYGVANLLFTTITVLYPVFTLAISEGALRFAMDSQNKRNEVLTIALLLNFIGFFLLLGSYFIFLPISKTIINYWGYFAVYYLGVSLHDSLAHYLKGIGKTKLYALQGIIQTFILITSNVLFLVFFRYGLRGYLIASIIGYWTANVFMVLAGGLIKDLFRLTFNKGLAKEMLCYSFPMIPTIIAWWANSAIDKYVIVAIRGLASNGLYSVAGKIPTILSMVTSLFSQAWQLSAISSYKDSDFEDYFNEVYYAFFVVNSIITNIFVIVNKPLCRILFSKGFYAAWVFVPFLLLANLFSSMSGVLASAFRATKKPKTLFVSALVGAAVNFVVNIILIKYIGVIGAALSTLVGFFIVWLLRMVFVQRIVKVRLPAVRTSLTIVLSLMVSVVFVIEMRYAYLISFALLVGVCLVNYSEIVYLASKIKGVAAKLLSKKCRR